MERTLRAEGKSEKTVYCYTLSVRLLPDFLEERGRDLTVDVAKDDIRDFIAEQGHPRLILDGWAGSTAPATGDSVVRFKSLQQFFRHCVEEESWMTSPMAGMRAPKTETCRVPDRRATTILTTLLKARSGKTLGDRRDTALLRVFLDTGCRLAEVTNLRSADVDLGDQTIRVRRQG